MGDEDRLEEAHYSNFSFTLSEVAVTGFKQKNEVT